MTQEISGGLAVNNLAKAFDLRSQSPVAAVDHVSFHVPEGEMFGVLGASGCGKTTLLRMIAGLEIPDSGSIRVGVTEVFSAAEGINLPPNRRDLSLVFQSYAIWPHLSVLENAAFPLRVRGLRGMAVEESAREALAAVRLADYAARPATALSGGEQQRLALARAFVSRPKLLLLDEPLSNLDAQLREQMRIELKRLQQEHRITTIFVTHDQAEALSLADTVGVMGGGRLLQIGPPDVIYERPATLAVARFIGSMNLVPGRATGKVTPRGDTLFATEWGEISAAGAMAVADREVVLGIRPERIRLGGSERAQANVFTGVISNVMYYGDRLDVFLTRGLLTLRATVPAAQRPQMAEQVVFSVDAEAVRVISATDGLAD